MEKGFTKIVQQFDDLEASREGAGQRETSLHTVRKHLEDIGLDGDIAQYNEISGLSGGRCTLCNVLRYHLTVTPRPKNQAGHCSLLVEQPSGTSHKTLIVRDVPYLLTAGLCIG